MAAPTTFTLGPWKADIGETATVRDAYGNQLAICTHINTRAGGRRSANEVAANTRLMAAAPDLLTALMIILRIEEGHGETDRPCMITARAAIAKATGATP